eukprot:gene8191-16839_t
MIQRVRNSIPYKHFKPCCIRSYNNFNLIPSLRKLPTTKLYSSGEGDESYSYDPNSSDEFFPTGDSKLTREEEEIVLENMRKERLLYNDRWQSCLFRDGQCGEWEGSFEVYQPMQKEDGLQLNMIAIGNIDSTLSVVNASTLGVILEFNENFQIKNNNPSGIIFKSIYKNLLPSDLRREGGNQIIGDAYTLGTVFSNNDLLEHFDIPEQSLSEIAIRDGSIRIRCRFLYAKSSSNSNNNDNNNIDTNYDMNLIYILIIKESLKTAAAMDILPLLDRTPGPGIYDPQASGPEYCLVDLPGKLSLQFPIGLKSPISFDISNVKKSTICMLYEGSKMRVQADRKFVSLNGAITSFEVTEIQSSDAEVYTIVEPP